MSDARVRKIAWRPNTTYRTDCAECGYRSSPIRNRRAAEGIARRHVCASIMGHFGCCDDWGDGHDDATCPCRPGRPVREHRPIERRELGYARLVCAHDGTDWPCPTVAQERERRAGEPEREPMTYEEKVAELVADGYDVEEARRALAESGDDNDDERGN